ncbi:MAG TPA: hypothetical protein VGW10_00630, partial [Solirubrobacteraceae bacterium]|nr:hypothetical protein [Solirubrobacteraceae bacterium]
MRQTRFLVVLLAGLLVTAFLAFGHASDPADPATAANPCADLGAAEVLREARKERGEQVGRESARKEAVAEGCALNEPTDVMLTRQLFGSTEGVTPGDVAPAARRATARLAADTRAAAPGIANAEWKLEGPANVGGRVLDVAVDPDQADTIFIAVASGGVWKSSDAGTTFEPVWPADAVQMIGALTMTKSGVLYAGTGETGPGGGSITYGGNGVYKSTDRGKTWQHIGLEKTSRISRIVIDPTNENRIFVAASGNLFKGTGDRGVYLSENGGSSWEKVLEGDNANTGASDVAINASDPSIVWATTWDHQRTPDQRLYEGEGSGVYKSTDGGHTFERVTAPGFGPDPQLGRIGIALGHGEEGKDNVFVVTTRSSGASGGVYKSTDGGTTFIPTYDIDFSADGSFVYGWWFGRLWVDPNDNDHVYVAGVTLLESTDGGVTFSPQQIESLSDEFPHADQHAMAWDPKVANRVYLGNDGGVYRSDENGAEGTWRFGDYQPFSQLYTLDVSEQDPSRKVAGLQDNGSIRSWGADGGQWSPYYDGDGQRTLIKPNDVNVVYACYQYGECAVSTNGGDDMESFTEEVVSARKNWTTPIEFDPEDPSTVYTGGEILNMSEDDAQTFVPISPDLSNGPGRETNPLFRNYGTLTTIAPAGKSTGTIYAGTDDGNLWYTHDQSNPGSWTQVDDPDLPQAWITRVEVDKRNPQVAYVSYSGFRSGDDAAYVLRTTDGGEDWENITGDLPKAPVNDINIIGDSLYVASDFGVFVTRDGGATWLKVGKSLPLAPIFELRHHPGTNRLYAGTFGRSIWSVDLAELDRAPVQEPTAEIITG